MAVADAQPDGATVVVYESADFQTWSYSNRLFTIPAGGVIECPDLFPLRGNASGLYALKVSHGPDVYYLGTYADRVFLPSVGPLRLDWGQGYASKSFYDAPNDRQVLWTWVAEEDSDGPQRGWQGMQSLPRVMDFNAETGTLAISPLPELQQLRSGTLTSVTSPQMIADGAVLLLPGASGLMLEVEAYFDVTNATAAEFGVAVRATSDLSLQTRLGLQWATAGAQQDNTDRPGSDALVFDMDPLAPEAENIAACASACSSNTSCAAFTYVRPTDAPCRCCLKSMVPLPNPNVCCVSGLSVDSLILSLNRTNSGTDGAVDARGGPVVLTAASRRVARLRVFVDHSIVEAFANDGLGRLTARVYPSDPDAEHVAVYAVGGAVTLINATVWRLASIWS
jgi:sucrose-6-phosphate hydrolase SacC (GH32 family)